MSAGASSGVAAVLLAAGRGRRFGGATPKQLVVLEGETMVHRLARRALASTASEVVVVTGHRNAEVATALRDLPVKIAECPDWQEGQSRSIRSGLAALGSTTGAALFVPVDQPFLTTAVLDRLIAARAGDADIVVPTARGKRRAPVLFGRAYFPELAALLGDTGGRQLFATHGAAITEVEIEEPRALQDFDTPEELAALLG